MTFRKLLASVLKRACIFFTVIATCYVLLTWLIHGADDSTLLINGFNLFFYFIFSFLLALANGILTVKALSGPLRWILHYVLCLFGFYSCFLLPSNMLPSQTLVGIVFFTLLYLLIVGAVALFRAKFRANKERNETYNKQFTKK